MYELGIDVERRAKALFDAEPHNHPRGRVPNWLGQPEHLKAVFRRKAEEGPS